MATDFWRLIYICYEFIYIEDYVNKLDVVAESSEFFMGKAG
jgi:hypothetical protein